MSVLTRVIQGVRTLIPDSAAAWAVRKYLNRLYPSLGEMTGLKLDPKNRKAWIELRLKGESELLAVNIESYVVTRSEGRTFIEIKEIQVTREWINYLAAGLLLGRKFEVPDEIRALV